MTPASRQEKRNAPIGVFDSGLGGLTVVRQMQQRLPNERIVFVADQAHVPYGGRDLKQVCGFACGLTDALIGYGCKAVIMACNISSATGLPHAQAAHPNVPILGVIEPGARTAIQSTNNHRIGVLATQGTVSSGAYTRLLQTLDSRAVVLEMACPDFVPLVEAEQEQSPAAFAAAQLYLAPMLELGVDTVILGCTHYPFLLSVLRQAAPAHIQFIDPALATVAHAQNLLAEHHLAAPANTPRHLLTTTGDPATFAHQLTRFLPNASQTATVAAAQWQHGLLTLPDEKKRRKEEEKKRRKEEEEREPVTMLNISCAVTVYREEAASSPRYIDREAASWYDCAKPVLFLRSWVC